MLSVPAATLRAWEDRYGVIVPERSDGGQRLYTRSQIEQLTFIQGSMEAGASAADAHRVLEERIAEGQGYVAPDVDKSVLILLAERDPFAADLAEYLLRTEGYEVILAFDATESYRLYEERVPAIVVLDLMISGGRGVALCKQLADRGAQIIAVSSVPQRERAVEAGADAFLRKPLEPLQLVSAVRDLLGTSALRTPEKVRASG
jgi:CheY-like chemotaxis protein